MNEGPVAHRVERLQWNAQHAEQRRPALHAGELRGDADPRAAFTDELDVARRPVGGGIESWFPYVLALAFLLVRPEGLFGERRIDRV